MTERTIEEEEDRRALQQTILWVVIWGLLFSFVIAFLMPHFGWWLDRMFN